MTGLGIDEDELAQCVSCGLCLPHCPTYRVTGEEMRSPRGRIALMRAVQLEGLAIDDEFEAAMSTCVQCRGCEPACPSGVQFGHMMAVTRDTLREQGRGPSRLLRVGLGALGRPRLLWVLTVLGGLAQRLGLLPRRLGLPRLPLRRPPLRATGADVWLLAGCVMDAWQRPVHLAVQRVIEATGARVAFPGPGAACCGALHEHAGLLDGARARARATMAAFPGEAPILVDAAGCGAAMKDYGALLGTDEARRFSARVLDVHEWLDTRLDDVPVRPTNLRVAVADPCHLRHVQRSHLAVHRVVARVAEVVETPDDGLCCGAGGAFAVLQPELASDIRTRKVDAIRATGADRIVSANPGCMLHLAAAGLEVRHPLELVADALTALGGPDGR